MVAGEILRIITSEAGRSWYSEDTVSDMTAGVEMIRHPKVQYGRQNRGGRIGHTRKRLGAFFALSDALSFTKCHICVITYIFFH